MFNIFNIVYNSRNLASPNNYRGVLNLRTPKGAT